MNYEAFQFTNIELGNNPDSHQLYNLSTDPGEKNNVYEQNKEVAEKLRAELKRDIERGAHYKGLKELKTDK